jgi:hypothetical protein
MGFDKEKFAEKLKQLSPEDKALFREALQEAEPDGFLSVEEVSTIRQMLAKGKGKKKGVLQTLDEIFDL